MDYSKKFFSKLFTIGKIYGIMVIGGERVFIPKRIKIATTTKNKKEKKIIFKGDKENDQQQESASIRCRLSSVREA